MSIAVFDPLTTDATTQLKNSASNTSYPPCFILALRYFENPSEYSVILDRVMIVLVAVLLLIGLRDTLGRALQGDIVQVTPELRLPGEFGSFPVLTDAKNRGQSLTRTRKQANSDMIAVACFTKECVQQLHEYIEWRKMNGYPTFTGTSQG
ncbi:hypothetical protein CHS0354_012399 [Potamilus streckersoni]|uniref:Uncharacterized protein n=1 Tax=Potamilus streckersoni TaxID=2493646 RepID=A0AAE0VMB3_9BIVA|nr:hypothetical protein CHS0354_012399 [Potamilus streckersoni]